MNRYSTQFFKLKSFDSAQVFKVLKIKLLLAEIATGGKDKFCLPLLTFKQPFIFYNLKLFL